MENSKTDFIKTWGTMFLVILLVCFTIANWMFPKDSKLAEQSISIMNNASLQMNKAATAIEASSHAQVALSNNLTKQLTQFEQSREKRYVDLVKKYGLVDLSVDADSVRPQDNHK